MEDDRGSLGGKAGNVKGGVLNEVRDCRSETAAADVERSGCVEIRSDAGGR